MYLYTYIPVTKASPHSFYESANAMGTVLLAVNNDLIDVLVLIRLWLTL